MRAETVISWVVSALKPFLSYRQVGGIFGISHTRLWETVQKLAKTIYKPKILAVKKQRKFIAVDETVIKMNGGKRFPWAAIDVESREVQDR